MGRAITKRSANFAIVKNGIYQELWEVITPENRTEFDEIRTIENEDFGYISHTISQPYLYGN
jgi:hypothetical protein